MITQRAHLPLALAGLLLSVLAACGDDNGQSAPDVTSPSDGTTTAPPQDSTSPSDTPSGDNRPPELSRIGDRVAPVDKPLVIVLEAQDADSDALTYSVFGTLPPGARFDKAARRFEWTPTVAGETAFLTFVVSDGKAFDRETVRIEVTAGGDAHPPTIVAVGDQQLAVGQDFSLQLQATDPDGDPLTWSHSGELPAGATLDAQTGLFRWRPTAAAVGAPVRVTFTVTDGALTAQLSVRFVVSDGGTGTPAPPVLAAIPAQTVTVGQTLTITLQATDPNDDALTFAIASGTPAGAALTGATFTWTPAQADAGRSFDVTFSASDGTFTALTTATINVTSGQTGSCTPDADEPNDTVADASALSPGSLDRTICESATDTDIDVYAISVPAGQQLTATLTFDGAAADLDLYLIDASQNTVAASEGLGSTEQFAHAPGAAGTFYLVVAAYGVDFGLPPISAQYTLVTTLGAPAGCQDDGYEPNDTAATARPVPDDTETLQICRDDRDFWSFQAQCGQRIEIGLAIQTSADLDMYLFGSAAGTGAPIASAFTSDSFEVIDVAVAPASGAYVLEVQGWEGAEAPYQLLVDTSGGCDDDALGNTSSASATALTGDSGTREDLVICCRSDWFSVELAAGETVTVDVTPSSGSVGLTAFRPDGTTQIQAVSPRPAGAILEVTATTAGRYYVTATGTASARYDLAWVVGTGGCTSSSCPSYEVCDSDTATCVSDFCFDASECPTDYDCVDTFCADGCLADDDCRPGYACKALRDGFYCIVEGSGGPGAGCRYHDECAEGRACLFEDRGGYCAEAGCGGLVTCDSATTACATVASVSFCAKKCNTTADCRAAEGYACSPEKTCLPPTQ